MKGLKIGSLSISARNIELDFGLTIASFDISSGPGSAVIDPFNLKLDEPGKMTATVTDQSVAQLLQKQSPPQVKDFRVQLLDQKILVDCTANIIVSIPVKAVCTLEIVNKNQLFVRLQDVDAMGGKATNIISSQIDKINPVLDAKDLPVNVEFTSVDCSDNLITLHGQVV